MEETGPDEACSVVPLGPRCIGQQLPLAGPVTRVEREIGRTADRRRGIVHQPLELEQLANVGMPRVLAEREDGGRSNVGGLVIQERSDLDHRRRGDDGDAPSDDTEHLDEQRGAPPVRVASGDVEEVLGPIVGDSIERIDARQRQWLGPLTQ